MNTHVKVRYQDEEMTKKELVRRFVLANPDLQRPCEILEKILQEAGITVSDNHVATVMKQIRGKSAKVEKPRKVSKTYKISKKATGDVVISSVPEQKVSLMNLNKGLDGFQTAITFLGFKGVERLMNIYNK